MNKKGFTLIELLIVIAIIGIVAAIAIPNLLTALQKGKQKSTMGDMKSIGTAIESYITDNYFAPEPGSDNAAVTTISTYLVPFHTKVLPAKDAWGNDYLYSSGSGVSNDVYSILSFARGGVDDNLNVQNNNYPVTKMEDFGNDICYSNGNFTYGPKVK